MIIQLSSSNNRALINTQGKKDMKEVKKMSIKGGVAVPTTNVDIDLIEIGHPDKGAIMMKVVLECHSHLIGIILLIIERIIIIKVR